MSTALATIGRVPINRVVLDPGFRLNSHQLDFMRHDAGIDFLVAGVGGGKSRIASIKLTGWGLRFPTRKDGRTPSHFLVLGRDFSVSAEQLDYIAENLGCLRDDSGRPIPEKAVLGRYLKGNAPEIELVNGVRFRAFSGFDPDRFRSHQFEGCWEDEAEFYPEKAFKMGINRQRAARAIRMIVTSSPGETSMQSWVWPHIIGDPSVDEFRKHNRVRIFRWASRENPSLDAAVLASIRATDPKKAARELDGLYLGTEVAIDGALDYQRAFHEHLFLTAADVRAQVASLDLGKTQDFTWLLALGATGVLLEQHRFNVSTPGVPRESFYPYVEDRVIDMIRRLGIGLVRLDVAMHGAAFAEQLKRAIAQKLPGARVVVEGYRTDSSKRKAEAIEALGVGLARGLIRICKAWTGPDGVTHQVQHVDQLYRELQELVAEDKNGYRTFDHPQGGHDDGVVALALGAQGIGPRSALADLSRLLPATSSQQSPSASAASSPFQLSGQSPFQLPGGSRS